MKILVFNNNDLNENCYLIIEDKETIIIDPGFNFNELDNYLSSNNIKPTKIFITHGHIDHLGDLDKLVYKYKDIKTYISKLDLPKLYDAELNCSKFMGINKIFNKDFDIIGLDDNSTVSGYTFFNYPGHTNGSMIIKKDKYLFTGDILFKDAVGRIDFPTGSIKDMRKSLKDIPINFSMNSIIYPGHYEKTFLKDEYKTNPYLK